MSDELEDDLSTAPYIDDKEIRRRLLVNVPGETIDEARLREEGDADKEYNARAKVIGLDRANRPASEGILNADNSGEYITLADYVAASRTMTQQIESLSTALEAYYQQDIQLYALARSLRSLESFNSEKAKREHVPYRSHLANAYGGAATALERIASKQAALPDLLDYTDKIVKLIEQFKDYSSPYSAERDSVDRQRERAQRYETLCREYRELLTGGW